MRAYDIIVKKRDGGEHTEDEIVFLIHSYTKGEIPDYQMSAWLMAGFLNGLNERETVYLTRAMLRSGKIMDLSSINKPKVDKHSTGGVGDKISLILAPAAAACGVVIPMTSGRGLGFSGGTLDKLESIPGYRVDLTERQFIEILTKIGFAMTGQTSDIAPADKKIYALRDVTATVENIALITSSILSKKLAEGVDSIIFDVKFGSGAFMKTYEEGCRLARSLSTVTKEMGKRAVCVLTSMEQPLGRAVGNRLEVLESLEVLRGAEQRDLIELTEVLGGYMLLKGGLSKNHDEGKLKIREKLQNGEAFERFVQSVEAQGGDVHAILNPEKLETAHNKLNVLSRREGIVIRINTEKIGTAAVFLGAGRFAKEDSIDPTAGIIIHHKIGEYVREGQPLATLHYNQTEHLKQSVRLVEESYTIGEELTSPFQLIHDIIDGEST